MIMSKKTRLEVLPRERLRYLNRGRKGKTAFLNEFCEQWQCDRKHAIKLLNAEAGWGGKASNKQGAPVTYGPEVTEVLLAIWKVAEQPCGKRMQALLPLWLPAYEARQELSNELREKLLRVSAATIDRLLAPHKARPRHGLSGTKPGSLLKTQIPIRTDNWDVDRPGFLEADTVAHCGDSLAGDFVWSVTYTDICSGWTCNRAVWNKGSGGVIEATREVEQRLPFALLGFDCDNGSEFLNWHLHSYFQNRPKPVGFTRSRPYKKNDNAHVEQKNWSHVRQLLGYDRLNDPAWVEPLNALYRDLWEPLNNYFLPSTKLIEKVRDGGKIKKRHDNPMTPCDRLLQSPHLTNEAKATLRATRDALDPITLAEQLEQALKNLWQGGPAQPSPTTPTKNHIATA